MSDSDCLNTFGMIFPQHEVTSTYEANIVGNSWSFYLSRVGTVSRGKAMLSSNGFPVKLSRRDVCAGVPHRAPLLTSVAWLVG